MSPELEITVKIQGLLAEALVQESAKRNRTPTEVVAEMIEIICHENLFRAVLDNEPND